MKVSTWLPIFPGFYNTFFDESDSRLEYDFELSESEFKEHYPELKELPYDYIKDNLHWYTDYQKAFEEASETICHTLLDLDHAGIIKDIEFEKLVSPSYYNFSRDQNDSINCTIDIKPLKLLKYLKEHLFELNEYILNTYTSRDGVSSHYSNDIEYWLKPSNWDEHQTGSLLDFVIKNENENAENKLYEASNVFKDFLNFTEFDFEKMVSDFKTKNKGV